MSSIATVEMTSQQLEATSQQLLAEIAASPYRSVRSLAEAMDVDYSTLYRHVNGKAPLRMERVFDILAYLNVSVGDFFARVQHRLESALRSAQALARSV